MDKIFSDMDRDKDAKLTYDEFVEGSKRDPTIVQVRLPHSGVLPTGLTNHHARRRSRYMMGSYSSLQASIVSLRRVLRK